MLDGLWVDGFVNLVGIYMVIIVLNILRTSAVSSTV